MPTATHPVALITGGSDGIGREMAAIFAENDHDLILVADHADKLNNAAREIRAQYSQIQVETIVADLKRAEAPQEVYDAVQNLGWPVEVLVNNAGIGQWGDFADNELEREIEVISVNVLTVVRLTKLFLRDMVQRESGKILITSSIVALSAAPHLAIYGATKAFDYNFALSLREELKDTGITVTALLPSETDTHFFDRADMEKSKIYDKKKADPAKVAKAGFDALMRGDDHVAAPFKAKAMALASNILPDEWIAHAAGKQQEAVD